MQITEYVYKKTGLRFDPLDVIQDISNISIVKPVFKEKNKETVLYIFVAGLLLFWDFVQNGLFSFVTLIKMPQFLIQILSYLLELVWALLVSYVFLTPFVKVFAKLQTYIWNKFLKKKARDKTVEEVIEEGYYKESSDKMDVQVVIFGHTHIAGSSYLDFNNKLRDKSKNKLFVNTGSWIKETDGRKLNTFAYIDNNGIEVLSWTGKKEEDKYVFEHVCTHTADSLKHLNTK